MGLLSSRFGPVAGVSEADSWLTRFARRTTKAGVDVTENSALHYSPVFACVRILAETLAMLPLQVFEETKSGQRQRVKSHPVAWLLGAEPNQHMTSFTFREALEAHVTTWGNAYAEIQRDGRGNVVALWPMTPDVTAPYEVKDDLRLIYQTTIEGDNRYLDSRDVVHVPGLGFDGYRGYSIVHMAAQAIGLGIAAEEFGSRWFGQGSQGGILLTHPGQLSPQAKENLRSYMEEENSGLDNSHRVRILTDGITMERIGIPPDDAQFLQTRKFQVSEAARFFRIQLSKLQELERQTHANIEQQNIEFIQDTMLPWFVRWEQELDRKLFRGAERQRFYCKFNVNGLLRGDSLARGEFYQKSTGGPWMSVNEARRLEEMDPIEGGDDIRNPLNMDPLTDFHNAERNA